MWLSDQSNMFSLPILVLILNTTPLIQALLPRNEAESFYGLASVAANLVTVDNTDVVIISDFELKQQVRFDFFTYLLTVSFGAVHKLCCVKIHNFWPPFVLVVFFYLVRSIYLFVFGVWLFFDYYFFFLIFLCFFFNISASTGLIDFKSSLFIADRFCWWPWQNGHQISYAGHGWAGKAAWFLAGRTLSFLREYPW